MDLLLWGNLSKLNRLASGLALWRGTSGELLTRHNFELSINRKGAVI
jgi:hypothetical protein